MWAAGQLREGEKVIRRRPISASNIIGPPLFDLSHAQVWLFSLMCGGCSLSHDCGSLILACNCWMLCVLCFCPLQVSLHEGLMVAVSRAGSLELQTQLLEVRERHLQATCRFINLSQLPGLFFT